MKKTTALLLCMSCALLLIARAGPQTGAVQVSWLPEYDEQFPDQSYLNGFVVYLSTTPDISANGTPFHTSVTSTNFSFSGLTRGSTYYFTVTQVGYDDVESDYGPIVSYTVPNKPRGH